MSAQGVQQRRDSAGSAPIESAFVSATLDNPFEGAPLMDNEEGVLNSRCAIYGSVGTICAVATVGLLALSIIKDFGDRYNALITFGLGLAFQGAIQVLPWRNSINLEKDILTDYSAEFFLAMTQVYLNVPQSRWLTRITFGTFNALLGAQIATKIDTIRHWNIERDASAESEALNRDQEPVRMRAADQPAEALNAHDDIEIGRDDDEAMPLMARGADERHVKMIGGNHAASRRITEAAKTAIAVVGLVLSYVYPEKTSIVRKLGWILLGHSAGGWIHETAHSFRRHFEKEFEQQMRAADLDPLMPRSVKIPKRVAYLRLFEKVEQVVGVVFPGIIIAFNTSYTDCLSGVCMGLLTHIDWIRYTKTPRKELPELDRITITNEPTYVKVIDVAKYLFAAGVAAFVAVAMYQGTAADRWALATFATVLYASYPATRLINRASIPSNRVINSLFFYTHFSVTAPILYIAINQLLQIGNTSLNSYPTIKIAISCLAYASLAFSLGTHAGERAPAFYNPRREMQTRRNRVYPAEINPLIVLFTNFFVQQLLGQV